MSLSPETIGSWRSQLINLAAVHSTRPRLVARAQAAIGYANAAEVSAQPIRGSKVTSLLVSLIGGATPGTVTLYRLTRIGTGAALNLTSITGTNTINRSAGSFITDGFQVGERYLLTGATGATNVAPFYANDIIIQPSAMGATALTIAGLTNEAALAATVEVWRLTQVAVITAPAAAGAAAGTTAVNILDRGNLPCLAQATPSPFNALFLGPNDALALALGAACTGVQTVEIAAEIGDA